jgi:2-polyprenyl-6-hydroxyphenyl methylase/3-demethylubiquinone-9 3-methyltransferase
MSAAGRGCWPNRSPGSAQTVTGVDPAPENIAAARIHAEGQGLDIDYRVGSIEALTGPYQLITALEVIEHVTDPRAFVAGLARVLAADGLLILSTPNRTGLSRFAMITLAEGLNRIPRGTHDWDKFLTPEELTGLVRDAGLDVADVRGLGYSVTRGFALSEDKSLNYLVTARRP